MASTVLATHASLGAQRPRLENVPEYASSTGSEAIELCAMAGLDLDDWQGHVLECSLGETAEGKWAAPEVGLVVARQNGKNAVQEARELVGLFLLPERLLIHSAHQFDTSVEQFRRLWRLIESTPDLEECVVKVSKSHGAEGIVVKVRGLEKRIDFRTRTGGGGRGFTCDCLVLDEAMILPEATLGALLPTLSAVPNAQVLYCGSAVDEKIHEHGVALSRVRSRGIAGDPALAYFEWSAEGENPDLTSEEEAADPENWVMANPGLGIRIDPEYVEREQRSMDPRTFAVERLGVGAWPDPDGSSGRPISPQMWARCADPDSTFVGQPAYAFDVAYDRSSACIAAAGKRSDGLWHIEVIKHRSRTDWVAPGLEVLLATSKAPVVCDASGTAGGILADLTARGVEVVPISAADHAAACGLIYDLVDQDILRHRDSPELRHAIQGAMKRALGDRWAWSRKDASVDICPLVAVTLALWGRMGGQIGESHVWDLRDL
jgi:hypothetical protein